MTHGPVVQSTPEILGGEPVFAGTRVPVRNLIDYLEHGSSIDEFLTESVGAASLRPRCCLISK